MGITQYGIVLVNLDPTVGVEIKKTRPCVVISPNELNDYLRTVIVAPMTTKTHEYPTRIKIHHDNKNGWVVMDQIRTIDKSRIVRTLGKLNDEEIAACKKVIKETFVD